MAIEVLALLLGVLASASQEPAGRGPTSCKPNVPTHDQLRPARPTSAADQAGSKLVERQRTVAADQSFDVEPLAAPTARAVRVQPVARPQVCQGADNDRAECSRYVLGHASWMADRGRAVKRSGGMPRLALVRASPGRRQRVPRTPKRRSSRSDRPNQRARWHRPRSPPAARRSTAIISSPQGRRALRLFPRRSNVNYRTA
jgi:hypothetical protein